MQLVWAMLPGVHLVMAALWLAMMPGGFPEGATEFWVNRVAPWFIVLWAVFALAAGGSRKLAAFAPPLLFGIPMFWIACGASARVAYPVSSGAMWGVMFVAGLALFFLWFKRFGLPTEKRWLIPIVALPALWAGWQLPVSQRSPEPGTRPLATALPALPSGKAETHLIKLTRDAQLRPSEGRLVVRRGEHLLTVQPLLSIESRSPDRSWVSLAPPEETKSPPRKHVATARDGVRWTMRYENEAATLEAVAKDRAIELEAHTQLAQDVYTHLNTYAELSLRGHRNLQLVFSPLPTKKIPVPTFTEPAVFAYLDESSTFHVARATSYEKGPFVDLGNGKLTRQEALTIQLYDGETLIYTVTFSDWASQASTDLSPTAGWRVPVNVIQFMRGGEAADAPALIALSLAATGIGRGYQSVGYKQGVYRNRMRIE